MIRKVVLLAAIALLNSSTATAAGGGCHVFFGTFTQQFVPCTVPALACVDATGTGNLDLSISHTVITGFDPLTQTYSGDVTLVRNNGSIITATIETVAGSGVGVETFTGGTRQFSRVTGTLVATATFPGSGTGTIGGQYCLAGDGGN